VWLSDRKGGHLWDSLQAVKKWLLHEAQAKWDLASTSEANAIGERAALMLALLNGLPRPSGALRTPPAAHELRQPEDITPPADPALW